MIKHLLIVSMFFLALLASGCLRPVRNDGMGMIPNIKDGDKIFLNTRIGELKRGDITAFLYPKDTSKWYIKRVIALPNEKIEIVGGKVLINGEQLDEPYLDENYNSMKDSHPPRITPAEHYFVLGDNRDNSSDSRYWGPVHKNLIQGVYYATYSQAETK
jgi:signal peptidase I